MVAQNGRNQSVLSRQAQILERVNTQGFATIADLASELSVSEMTIRRDADQLEQSGALSRLRGVLQTSGARIAPSSPDYSHRSTKNLLAKQKLGKAAAALVGDGDVIAVDAGTTTFQLLDNLADSFSGTVITHSIPAINSLQERSRTTTLCLGGELYRPTRAMVGSDAIKAALGLRADIFFLGAASIDERGVYANGDVERDIKRALIDVSDLTVLMVDQQKLSSSAPVCICNWDKIDTLLTDGEPPASLRRKLEAENVKTIVV